MNTKTGAAPGGLTTESLANAIGAKAGSIRVRLCQTGSYFGIKPKKLPNGRLLWPAVLGSILGRAGDASARALARLLAVGPAAVHRRVEVVRVSLAIGLPLQGEELHQARPAAAVRLRLAG